jgi:GT2 family glycosyltransferase
MNLSIIIPTFNRREHLKILLNQLKAQKLSFAIKVEVVVVLDGSSDGTLEMLQQEFPKVHIVEGDGNWWYTKSMNEGFKYAESLLPDFVLTLNDDIEVNPDYISKLLLAYNSVEEGSIMGSLSVSHSHPHKVTNSGNSLKNKLFGIYRHHLPFMSVQNIEMLSGVKDTVTLPGRGILIPFKTLKDLNYFDEFFMQYHSDGDFCLRAKEKGYKVYVSWDAVVFSHMGLTSSSSSFKKQTFNDFINTFFDNHSRNYLPARAVYIWRHHTKWAMPFVLFIGIVLSFKNFFLKKKM